MFDKKINVQAAYATMNHIVKQVTGKIITKNKFAELQRLSKRIIKFQEQYINKYKIQIHPEKLQHLTQILSYFMVLNKSEDTNQISRIWSKINGTYELYNAHSATYLLRHPEKMHANRTTAESAGERALSAYGVKQAKEVADFLIEEILITNKPVSLVLNYSDFKRTRLLAEIIKKKVEWMEKKYGKHVAIHYAAEDLISGNVLDPNIKTIPAWLPSKNAQKTASLIKQWFEERSYISEHKYIISVGVTHLPNICAFLAYGLEVDYESAQDFRYVEFIKLDHKNFYYRGKWN